MKLLSVLDRVIVKVCEEHKETKYHIVPDEYPIELGQKYASVDAFVNTPAFCLTAFDEYICPVCGTKEPIYMYVSRSDFLCDDNDKFKLITTCIEQDSLKIVQCMKCNHVGIMNV